MHLLAPLSLLALSASALPLAGPVSLFATFTSRRPAARDAETRSELETIQLELPRALVANQHPARVPPTLDLNARADAADMIHWIAVERCGRLGC